MLLKKDLWPSDPRMHVGTSVYTPKIRDGQVFFSANVAIWARRLAFSASRTVSWLLVCSALSFHCSRLLVTSATRFLSRLIEAWSF